MLKRLFRKCSWDPHVWMGRDGDRTRQRGIRPVMLSQCNPSDDCAGSSEAGMPLLSCYQLE